MFPDSVRRETAEGVGTYREVRYPLAFEVGEQPLTALPEVGGALLEMLAPREELGETDEALWPIDPISNKPRDKSLRSQVTRI